MTALQLRRVGLMLDVQPNLSSCVLLVKESDDAASGRMVAKPSTTKPFAGKLR